ncbi:MAG: hypothetical protein ACLUVG_01490 [Phocaeicola vulgatus]
MKEPEETFVEFAMNKEYIRLKSDALQVEVNSSTGGINFYDATGRVLLKDKDYGCTVHPALMMMRRLHLQCPQAFLSDKDEAYFMDWGNNRLEKQNRSAIKNFFFVT